MLERTLVGVGGWAYLPVRHVNKLKVCSKLYDFVELNSTYYKLPLLEDASKWRKTVPEEFEFTVRANSKLTHDSHLEPTEENFRIYQKTLNICDALNATVLHFQFPPAFEVTDGVVRKWREFFNSAGKPKIREYPHLAFEIRNEESRKKYSKAIDQFYSDYDIIPTTDASRDPSNLKMSEQSKVLYTRVFGSGEHTKWSFDSDELESIKERVEKTPARKHYITFHNITMYEDASRMKDLVERREPKVSALAITGTESLKDALIASRIRFPASKSRLETLLSWRTFDLAPGKKIHVGKFLERLPENREFDSIEEILESLPPLGE